MFKALVSAPMALLLAFAPVVASAQDSEPDNSATAAATQRQMRIAVDYDQTKDLEDILYLDLSNGQRVAIRLMPDWAPGAVERIKTLTRQGFYDGVIFHRVIDGFMAQTGDPTGTGQGGSELPDLKAEFNPLPHVRGTVSMARAESEDSANSQFFIMFYPRFALDKRYTNFGRVIGNMAAVDAIHRGEPPQDPTWIVQASIASDHKAQKFADVAPPAVASAGAN
ncbi:peptidylprolyl isomerase [Altererythrobacter salegens]|uniref:Peptidyl-prolyl cis-trans isomerase n=1 Tax=Croceibacterium salegens TaxID=1737568 RepID=A0A6I4SSB8_9SPHN|nr:peptidylprolyl isomerase [Croceibacterium salegens]MXO58773.1 peptidylprolyl isomerase [Croceibacterium salegens]